MKKISAIALVFTLTALLFAGCRDTTNTTPTTTKQPATSAATQSTVLPAPDITLPMDTTTTTVPGGSSSTTGSAARGPRY